MQKLLFLLITLQHVGIWSTKIDYLDVRAALQAETRCMIKERRSCAPLMRQESQCPIDSRKSQLSTTLDGGHRDDRLWSMGFFFLDHKGKVFSFDPRTGQKIEFHTDTWWMGSDDEVGATGERQQKY